MYYVTPWIVHEDPNHSAHYSSLCICASVHTYMLRPCLCMYVCMKTATRIGKRTNRCDISPQITQNQTQPMTRQTDGDSHQMIWCQGAQSGDVLRVGGGVQGHVFSL